MRQVLQSVTILFQSATGITKCDDYYKVRQYNVHDDVRSLVHCKFNDDQGKIGLISFMKTVTADRGSWTKRQGERC